jgi:catalase-peroxidase
MENNSRPTSYNVNGEQVPFSAGQMLKQSERNGKTNRDWWPNQLKLNILRQNSLESNPMGAHFIMPKNSNQLI